MLTDEMRREIEAVAGRYEQPRAACIEAMLIVQRKRRWIDDASIRDIAELLQMTPEEVDGVATFYNLIRRKPVGRHVILLCTSVSCWVMGYGRLVDYFRDRWGIGPGQTTPDGRFTLLPNQCLGACDHAPTVMIDDELHRDLDTDALDRVLARYE